MCVSVMYSVALVLKSLGTYNLGLEGPGLGLGLDSCTDKFLASPSNFRPNNYCSSYTNKLIIIYK